MCLYARSLACLQLVVSKAEPLRCGLQVDSAEGSLDQLSSLGLSMRAEISAKHSYFSRSLGDGLCEVFGYNTSTLSYANPYTQEIALVRSLATLLVNSTISYAQRFG